MSIRSRLVWLVIAVIAPAFAFALYGTYAVYRAQTAQVDQGMKEVSRAVALAVDRTAPRARFADPPPADRGGGRAWRGRNGFDAFCFGAKTGAEIGRAHV